MRTKSFCDLIEKRLTKNQIAEIERQAKLEVDTLKSAQRLTPNYEMIAKFLRNRPL